ncbi:VRR-NUC domain-containing protein [Beijerinckia sp. L45]|uniref:VRR-NUC domain-containing protein n=1 Tax=Beijerinckia sp. L45 TaxID=1641855 RepID=UPI00131CBBEA|nr:VRR-NUC domain-containing protein [Beijerinckia sp. L45]
MSIAVLAPTKRKRPSTARSIVRGGIKLGPEDQIQLTILEWFAVVLPEAFVFHIPNERKCSFRAGSKLKMIGVRPGVADLGVMLPRGRQIYIEVKDKDGELSPAQESFWLKAKGLGFECFVARSVDDVRRALSILGIKTREAA